MTNPLRARLPRTWQAFLGRFDRPTEVQVAAVPPLLERRDALICAPTASGKTEAYAAPAVEGLLAGPRAPLALLIVSPTRALANDLKRRLEGRMHEVGVSFGRSTSEHKERDAGRFPEAVVTTPEGLDSLLARRAPALAGVRTIVLDELHVLDGTPRGDQLRLLLHRLDRAAELRPQRVAASATVGDPQAMAARYLIDPAVIAVGGARGLRFKAFPGSGLDALAAHVTTLAREGLRKVLVFCNARERVEQVAAGLRGRTPFADRVFAHHGSLSRTVRERTERHFLEAPAAVCASTMTLELGIDIGTVDYVLLADLPHDVASLMQRVGRGGRRKATTRVGCACDTPADELLVRTMLRCGARGELHERPYAFRPGVLVQQALCLAGGRGHVTAQGLRTVVPPAIAAGLGRGFAELVLGRMVEHGLLEAPVGGRCVLAPKLEEQYERGVLHSNFRDAAGLSVVDRLTGEVIGSVQRGGASGRVSLGGAARREVAQLQGRILTDRTAGGEAARYRSGAAPATSFGLARAVAAELGAEPDELLQTPLGASVCLVHGLGTLGGLLLAEALRPRLGSAGVARVTAFTLRLARPLAAEALPRALDVEGFVRAHEAELARLCDMGRFHAHLPAELERAALAAATGLAPVAEWLATARLRSVEPDPLLEPTLAGL